MKKLLFLFVAFTFLVSAPITLLAQGFSPFALPGGFLGFGDRSGSSSCCGDPGLRCCPAFYVGYNIRQDKDRNPVRFGSIDRNFDQPLGRNELELAASDPSGVWLGVSQYCQLSECVGIMASGWYLFPTTGDAQEFYDPISQGTIGPIVTGDPREWSANKSEGWIDGALVLGSPCGLNLIGGFRWDSLSLSLKNPVSVNGITVPRGTTADEANLTANWYIPFLGTQYCCGGPCCGLLVRIIGFPWIPGTVTYGETGFFAPGTRVNASANFDRAAFIEVWSEASRSFGTFGCLGIFGRYNYIDGRGTATPTLVGTGTALPAYDLIVRRSSWTIGGKIALNFDLPF